MVLLGFLVLMNPIAIFLRNRFERRGGDGRSKVYPLFQVDLRPHGIWPAHPCLARNKAKLEEIVESSLRVAALWSEVKDRLREPGTGYALG